MNTVGVVVGAGTVAYLGSAREASTIFPSNTVKIFAGTSLLAIGASLVQDGPLREPVKWLAILMLITAVVRYVPVFNVTVKKGKTNG